MEKGYTEKIIRNQLEKSDNLERSTLLNKTNPLRKNLIPFSVTYSPTLPKIGKIINKHWHISNINNTFGNVFNKYNQPQTEGQAKCQLKLKGQAKSN